LLVLGFRHHKISGVWGTPILGCGIFKAVEKDFHLALEGIELLLNSRVKGNTSFEES